jgi:thiamine pyrophosphokinase
MSTWWMDELHARYDALIVANGTPPPVAVFRKVQMRCDNLIALDGGLNIMQRWKVVPEHIIGDLDSATGPTLTWASKHDARIHPMPSQESADMDKGLYYCRLKQWKKVLILGAEGDRLDHVLNALSSCSAARGLEITYITRRALMFMLRGKARRVMKVPRDHAVSWFGMPEAMGCSLTGVTWPFRKRILRLGGFSSLSNLPNGEEVVAEQTKGCTLLIVSLKPKPPKTLLFK